MTAESERGPSDARSTSGPAPKPNPDSSPLPDDSPEMLRWRADSLMEEMMLGAVDVSAAGVSGSDADDAGGGFEPESASSQTQGASPMQNGDGSSASTAQPSSEWPSFSALDDERYTSDRYSSVRDEQETRGAAPSSFTDATTDAASTGAASPAVPPAPTPEWRIVSGTGSGRPADAGAGDYVPPSRSTGYEAAATNKWQPDFSEPESGSSASGATRPVDGPRQAAPGREAGAPAAAASAGYAGSYANSGETGAPPRSQTEASESAGTSYVSAMAVMPGGPRRSALLPRMSEFDAEALHKEIADLHAEIRKILPVGHETAERARHLLDKANTILNSDPMRSAEVEYYMQQVRTIVQRMRQAHRWSDLYRNRLRLYLVAWALLAIIVLSALALFPWEAEDFAAWLTAAANDSLFVINFVGFAGTVMAGALGGSLGALLTMRRHANAEYSLFDRKYGLRGLLLPVIGALAGGVIYLIFGATYYFVRINPSLSVAAMAAPALLAFVLGFSQESIYGTRE